MNSGDGTKKPRVIVTEEAWRAGGDDADVVFGSIGGIARDKAGNTFLLDTQRNEIHLVTANGQYAGTIGREGEGPGEFRMASGITLLSGEVVCVTQAVPARAVLIKLDGSVLNDHPIGPDLVGAFINGCGSVGGRLAICCGQTVPDKAGVGFREKYGVLDSKGAWATTYWELFRRTDAAHVVFDEKSDAEPVWAFADDGRFLVNDNWDEYSVKVFDSAGRAIHVTERAYEHRPRDRHELEGIDAKKREGEIPQETKISSTSRDVVRLVPRANGVLWVISGRGDMDAPDGVVAVLDEFDGAGVFLNAVTIRGPHREPQDEFYVVDDHLFVVLNGREGVSTNSMGDIEVVCLRVAPR